MIPKFPYFKTLTVEDKEEIDRFVEQFPPYSDYNFISMFVWCTEPPPLISLLNGNLVVRLNDYVTNEAFYSFLGKNKTVATAKTLLAYSKTNGFPDYLKLIPEISIQADESIYAFFDVLEDRDQFDYIFSLEELDSHSGNKYSEKRNFINRFKKNYRYQHREVDIKDPIIQKQILELFEVWGKVRKKDREEIKQELVAYKKALKSCNNLKLIVIGLYVDEKLIGVSINEILHDGYAINLFEKGDITYTGVFQLLKHLAGVYLTKEGCKFLNFEQDLGVEGLRKSKTSYHPVFYLKKYILYSKSTD